MRADEKHVEEMRRKLAEAEAVVAERKEKESSVVGELAKSLHDHMCSQHFHYNECMKSFSKNGKNIHEWDKAAEKQYMSLAETLIEDFPDLTHWQIMRIARTILS